MTKTKTYQTLTAGDVRKEGDECRKAAYAIPQEVGAWYTRMGRSPRQWKAPASPWLPVNLLSHPILASDLIHLEFRRPI